VTLDLDEGAVGLWDRLRLEQIVSNLLNNASKFGAGHPIEIRVRAGNGVSRLELEDHGIGIDAPDQARIFERFERAVPTRNYGGFGLGLWIVRRIAEALGGSVSVESRLGRGSKFTVVLPQVPRERGIAAEARPQ
jgi:signal transduction histidine kinase